MSKVNVYKLIAILTITLSLILMISSFWNDSLIVDEIPHIGAGYSYLEKLDYRLNPEHPPLGKMVATLPLLFLKLKQGAFETPSWETHINGQWEFGRSLIFKTGNDANFITRMVKFPMLLFFILTALMTWHWTKKLYSKKAGLIALVLFCFSTTIMAHSRFVTTDVPALFGVLFATYFFLKYLHEPTTKNLWIAGLIFGVAQLTKFSLFLLAPYFLLLALVWGLVQAKKSFTVQFLVSTVLIFIIGFIFMVWPIYTTITSDYPIERQYNDTKTLLSSFGRRSLADSVTYLSGNPITRGLAQYGLGLLMVVQRASGGNTTY
ncbi:MAG: glycosyltransferase family 39 protein, partial [Parcubacteria group bacterium]|nr:glycosyltransferase family 39 protein [Parcubacteria group bacterium]